MQFQILKAECVKVIALNMESSFNHLIYETPSYLMRLKQNQTCDLCFQFLLITNPVSASPALLGADLRWSAIEICASSEYGMRFSCMNVVCTACEDGVGDGKTFGLCLGSDLGLI